MVRSTPLPWRRRLLHVLWLAACLACHDAFAQSLAISPGPVVLDGETVTIEAIGLLPQELVDVEARRWFAASADRPPRLFQAQVRLRADAGGRVNLATMAPLSGSYEGADPFGLFWSMSPLPTQPPLPDELDTRDIQITLQREDKELLRASLRLLPALPQVQTRTVEGLPGAIFARLPGPQKRPGLILLGGSEGDDGITEAAASFASHGFAVLALPYFSPPDENGVQKFPTLPPGVLELPVEVLDAAHDWLARQPGVDADRMGVHGTSVGSALALLGALHLPWVDAVVASVPSDVVFDGWGPGIPEGERSAFSLGGKPLPFVPQIGFEEELARAERGLDMRVRRAYERGRAAHPDLAVKARIRAEDIPGEVMLIGAYDDQVWPSGMMAQNLAERRLEAGRPVTVLLFPDAGHLLYGTGYIPTTTRNLGQRKVGGTPASDARAQARAWRETLVFLQQALGVEGPVSLSAYPDTP